MAGTVKITLPRINYRTPTDEDLRAAKAFVLAREETSVEWSNDVNELLSDAAERIVLLCYRYRVDPKTLLFSDGFNEDLMNEVEFVMDELEQEIYDLLFVYGERGTEDRDISKAIMLWMVTLGKGGDNLRDTLHNYLHKTMKDWEAAIAAMRYMGVPLDKAAVKIKTYLHHIYDMPEVLAAIRRKGDFAATYIRFGGVDRGAVGRSNNGSTNVVNMGRITIQMAWMRSMVMGLEKRGDVAGIYIVRGSTYDCPVCDENVGFHTLEEARKILPVHPFCKCVPLPIYIQGNNNTPNNE